MNVTAQSRAIDKQRLLLRSALCRLRLRSDAQALGNSLHWTAIAKAIPAAHGVRRLAFDITLALAGHGRAARLVMLAARIVLLVKLARSALLDARKAMKP